MLKGMRERERESEKKYYWAVRWHFSGLNMEFHSIQK